jgi:hypothetical protein
MIVVQPVFLSTILDQIHDQYQKSFKHSDRWSSVQGRWESALTEGFSGSIRVYDLGFNFAKMLVRESVHRHLSSIRYSDPVGVQYRAQFCQFYQGSGMNAHCDSHYLWAATVYLNKTWDRLCGGWLCADDFVHVPCYNSMVVNTDHSSHFVSEVYSSEPRITLQLWAIQ